MSIKLRSVFILFGVILGVIVVVGAAFAGIGVGTDSRDGEFVNAMDVATIDLDIKPGNPVNPINPKSNGVFPVMIKGSASFDVLTVSSDTVRHGVTGTEAPPVKIKVIDVDLDGYQDMSMLFRTKQTGVVCGTTALILTGTTTTGIDITGSDNIKTVGCKRRP